MLQLKFGIISNSVVVGVMDLGTVNTGEYAGTEEQRSEWGAGEVSR